MKRRKPHDAGGGSQSEYRLRLLRAQLESDPPLLRLGSGLVRLLGGQRADDSVYRRGHRAHHRSDGRHPLLRVVPADRDDDVELPVSSLRRGGGDHRLGTLGGHHRVHADGAGAAFPPPAGHVLLRGDVCRGACGVDLCRSRDDVSGRPPHSEPVDRAGGDRRRQRERHRPGDGGCRAAAAVHRAGSADDFRHPLEPAAHLRRLRTGGCTADLAPSAVAPVADDVRASRGPRRSAGGCTTRCGGRRSRHSGGDGCGAGARWTAGISSSRALRASDRAFEKKWIDMDRTATRVDIRSFTTDDYAAVTRLFNLNYPDFQKEPDEVRFEDESAPAHCRWRRWVADCDGYLVGFAGYRQNPGTYHPRKFSLWMGVDPDWYLRGTGRRLYQVVLEAVERLDPLTLDAWCRDDMPCLLGFLERRGFVRDMLVWTSV